MIGYIGNFIVNKGCLACGSSQLRILFSILLAPWSVTKILRPGFAWCASLSHRKHVRWYTTWTWKQLNLWLYTMQAVTMLIYHASMFWKLIYSSLNFYRESGRPLHMNYMYAIYSSAGVRNCLAFHYIYRMNEAMTWNRSESAAASLSWSWMMVTCKG